MVLSTNVDLAWRGNKKQAKMNKYGKGTPLVNPIAILITKSLGQR